MYRTAALVAAGLVMFTATAYAADAPVSLALVSTPIAAETEIVVPPTPPMALSRSIARGASRRPSVLPALYVSLAMLQGYDGYSTSTGLAHGARESNSVMRGVAGNPAALWAVKAGSTAVSIWAAERMWKTNRVGAVVTMVAVNSLMASVAARNASVLKTLR